MKVTITKKEHDGKVGANRKERAFSHEYAVFVAARNKCGGAERRGLATVTLRIYNTDMRSYACVWVSDSKTGVYLCGGGRAGGYGYHRPSAAAQAALNDCGLVLSEDIGGRGDSAIEAALCAVARAVTGKKDFFIHVAHA